MALLTQFLLRVSFGLAAAMAIVSPRQVTSGYFRNHLYVVLGLSALAALLSRAAAGKAFGWALAAAVLSYVGSVLWLYEKHRLGVAALVVVAGVALMGALTITSAPVRALGIEAAPSVGSALPQALRQTQTITSGLLLGFTLAAMLLGHWYLNAPGMQLAPLRKLLIAMALAIAAHAAVCSVGLALELAERTFSTQDWLFLIVRWAFGLAGVMVLVWLTWQTLAIPNTQSATGILYVAVIGVFVGETMSLLLSAESLFPL
jgi:hypothetical protein